MNDVVYEFPLYVEEILESLVRTNWFIHSFDLQNMNDIYNPAAYLYNSEFEGVKYSIFLDLNIYQYILSAVKKKNKNQLHRDAIALMVFGKITNSIFDPTLAVYEKLNYREQCPDDLISDLILFRQIDNADIESLAKFSLSIEDNFELTKLPDFEVKQIELGLTKYKRLKTWDTFYLYILKIVEIYFSENISDDEKIVNFHNWCFEHFKYSLVTISFVIKLMGKQPSKKLMKYRSHLDAKKRKEAIVNMTWDLFLLNNFFDNWVNKSTNQEFVYASNDKPLKEVLEIAISIQKNEGFDHLEGQLSSKLIKELSDITDLMSQDENRNIAKVSDFKQFRDKLINNIEMAVLHRNGEL